MNRVNLKGLRISIIVFIAFSVWSSSFETCCARDGRQWIRQSKAVPGRSMLNSATFNVLNYGAKGDGHADDTKAFEAAWAAACKVEASTIVVPSGSVFLVAPVSFSGCEPNIVFQVDGKIIAPQALNHGGQVSYSG
ncbi:hypothetical protein SLA2020_268970 [Shorea laevis]